MRLIDVLTGSCELEAESVRESFAVNINLTTACLALFGGIAGKSFGLQSSLDRAIISLRRKFIAIASYWCYRGSRGDLEGHVET